MFVVLLAVRRVVLLTSAQVNLCTLNKRDRMRTTQGVVLFFFELPINQMETHQGIDRKPIAENRCACQGHASYELKFPYLPFELMEFEDTSLEAMRDAAIELSQMTCSDTELWENCSCGKTSLLYTYR